MACNTGDALGHTDWGGGTMAGDIQGCCQKKVRTWLRCTLIPKHSYMPQPTPTTSELCLGH